jgi:Tol biopolymer transport system component
VSARALGAGALAAGLFLVAAACGGASGEPRPDLLLVSTRDGDYAIYELDADGGNQRRLTDADSGSSDGETLFLQIDPAWAPDGTRIAFASKRGASFDLYTMRSDGTGSRRTTSTKENDAHPTWSPDGSSLAFARSGPPRIYVVSPDGTGARRLTDDTAEEAEPSWSPDGTWIAYTRRTPGTTARELWIVRPDGSDRRRVTDLERAIFGPTWSPDSKRIAFAADVDAATYDIYSVDLRGEGIRRHTQAPEDAFEPAWSPDGRTIAFSRGGAIETVDLDGSLTTITDAENNDSSPAWNPVPPPPGEEPDD